MRDKIARAVVFGFGAVAIVIGILALLGYSRLESRTATIMVGITAVASGIMLIRSSRGPNPRIGGSSDRSNG